MDPRTTIIKKRLQNIDRIIAVASGKGGVGKSMVAAGLALSLAAKNYKVGLLDLDMYGPSAHVILGVTPQFPEEDKGVVPPEIHGIRLMSMVYYTQDKPLAFRGKEITNSIIELLTITQWGDLDFLIVDMPPGLGDETLDVMHWLHAAEFLVVSTPSRVAMEAVKKLLLLVQELKYPLLGVIENMTMPSKDSKKKEIEEQRVYYLGNVSFDTGLEGALGFPDKIVTTQFFQELDTITSTFIEKK